MSGIVSRREAIWGITVMTGGLCLGVGQALAGKKKAAGHAADESCDEPVYRAKDPANMSLHEKKHVPKVILPEGIPADEPFDITVTVGEVVHPMVTQHYIEYVEIFLDGVPAGRVEFKPEVNLPKATFTLKVDKPATLVVRERCNLHGVWESRIDLPLVC